jgi:exopolysaccharide production protein ExoQ
MRLLSSISGFSSGAAMPPVIALSLTLTLIATLLVRDARQGRGVTGALWIPFAWMLLSGSRFVSQWIALFSGQVVTATPEDGSPIDRVVFGFLIGCGVVVLIRRRVSVGQFVANNLSLTVFFAYCLLAVAWSDFPFIALKRWVKTVGEPLMALIVLTEPRPLEAFSGLIRRVSYVLIPLSVTFIKYFPLWGRSFSNWTGEPQNIGATANKNNLGYLCLISGAFFVSVLLQRWRGVTERRQRLDATIEVVILGATAWLMSIAGATTGLGALLIAVVSMTLLDRRLLSRKYIGTIVILGALTLWVGDAILGVFDSAIDVMGKDATLTGRLPLWNDVLSIDINPIIGRGFESFWLGDRIRFLQDKYWWGPTQAHNGYIEVYLNLGIVGVLLLSMVLIEAFWRIKRELFSAADFAEFHFGMWLAILVYNYTDATFKALHVLSLMFYLIALKLPRQAPGTRTVYVGRRTATLGLPAARVPAAANLATHRMRAAGRRPQSSR